MAQMVTAAELGPAAVAVHVALARGHDGLAMASIALRLPLATVRRAGVLATIGIAYAPLEAGAVNVAEAGLRAGPVAADQTAGTVIIALAAGGGGRAGPILAHRAGRALLVGRAADRCVGLAHAVGTGETVRAGVRAGVFALALAANTLAEAVRVLAADLRFGADARHGIAGLRPGTVRVGSTCPRDGRNAERALAAELGAAVLCGHAGARPAAQRSVTPQVAGAGVGRWIAAGMARAVVADAVLVGETGVVGPAGGRLGTEAALADLGAGAGGGITALGAVDAGAGAAELALAALCVGRAARAARAAARLAGVSRPANGVGGAGIGAALVVAIAFAQAVVVAAAGLGFDADRPRRIAGLVARAFGGRATAVVTLQLAQAGPADLFVCAVLMACTGRRSGVRSAPGGRTTAAGVALGSTTPPPAAKDNQC